MCMKNISIYKLLQTQEKSGKMYPTGLKILWEPAPVPVRFRPRAPLLPTSYTPIPLIKQNRLFSLGYTFGYTFSSGFVWIHVKREYNDSYIF